MVHTHLPEDILDYKKCFKYYFYNFFAYVKYSIIITNEILGGYLYDVNVPFLDLKENTIFDYAIANAVAFQFLLIHPVMDNVIEILSMALVMLWKT